MQSHKSLLVRLMSEGSLKSTEREVPPRVSISIPKHLSRYPQPATDRAAIPKPQRND